MAKLKVLVAEDDLTMVNLLQTLLKMEGFDVLRSKRTRRLEGF